MKRPLAYITAPWSENEFENTENAAKYCRAVYDAGFSPVCPTLFLPLFQEASPLFERDITEALDIPSIVAARTTEGGTAPAAVAVQLQRAEAQLVADEGVFGSLTKVVEMGHGAK